MNMTHYMQLLADNQPWNLIFFMVIPVFLAETVAITELFVLFHRSREGMLRQLNRLASIAGGAYFLGVLWGNAGARRWLGVGVFELAPAVSKTTASVKSDAVVAWAVTF